MSLKSDGTLKLLTFREVSGQEIKWKALMEANRNLLNSYHKGFFYSAWYELDYF